MTTHSHIRRVLVALAAAALAAALLPTTGRAYPWPVKPFDQPHPIRGSFGDPRTIFTGPPTAAGLNHSPCYCSFHQGVDISAPDRTAVYPVVSGTVAVVHTQKAAEMVAVVSGDTTFEYWHIASSVRVGQKVDAGRTVLGHIVFHAGHVHLTETHGDRPVNPLRPGHLTPYRDTTRPVVGAISFRDAKGSDLMPNFVRGHVEIVVDAHDSPALPVPGRWNAMPVTPARLTWRIERWDGKVVRRDRTAYDVRRTLPSNERFWNVYARGTFQNMAVFGNHYSFLQPGSFLFRLAPDGFDTRRLRDCVYVLVVTATDIAGNAASSSIHFTVHNAPGYAGKP
jgi:hypothetical protein